MSRRLLLVSWLALAPLTACSVKDARGTSGTTVELAIADSIVAASGMAQAPIDRIDLSREPARPRHPHLTPLADTMAGDVIFSPRGQIWYTAAARGKRLLLDLGRVDVPLATPERIAAYQEVVSALAPVRLGDRFALYGIWGTDSSSVTGFDVWNNRIVATLSLSVLVDSLARTREPMVVAALRTDSLTAPRLGVCARDSVSQDLVLRAGLARDSIEQALRDASTWLPERLLNQMRVESSSAIGCFGEARMLVIVTLVAGNYEFVRQGAAAITEAGSVTPLAVFDPRFKAHQALHALDADGDGLDDIAARGRAERLGALVVLRYNKELKRLERLTTGFAWESR